jgi:hypothetical protein
MTEDQMLDQLREVGEQIGEHRVMSKLTQAYLTTSSQEVKDFILSFIRKEEK